MSDQKYLLGIDLGSSSVKASLVDLATGSAVASCFEPSEEMPIHSPSSDWAEQDPEMWWQNTVRAIRRVTAGHPGSADRIEGIGISYQMHGLVLLDKEGRVLRPAIIWCDSRAVDAGDQLTEQLEESYCFDTLLNVPGNFTASKLKWVIENEPEIFDRVHRFMLPGDYIAYRLTGEYSTTSTGLSEGIFWDFESWQISGPVLDVLGVKRGLVPDLVPEFGLQGRMGESAAKELGMQAGVPIGYRAGDQPNNALSLKVSEAGQVAATAGTSGVIYAVTDIPSGDKLSRVNTFLHPSQAGKKYGILLCVNGTGIAYNWIRRISADSGKPYDELNQMAGEINPGSDGLQFFPFGNGAERMLSNRKMDAALLGINFNRHSNAHIFRAVQEGVCFAMYYGFEVLESLGSKPSVIRVADANMFKSPIFCQLFTDLTNCRVELYDTDGARGAALAAGVGLKYYPSMQDIPLKLKKTYLPSDAGRSEYLNLYQAWKKILIEKLIKTL
ncbi:xylulokinase [Fulvivirga sedimenti]|uniref:Carbohydrate kinase n=1 Tax=Fulvivirga sedimenti TaxID=2879465 RepID=A0A9X1KY27_9BACT|nr:FGGY family carbohydrate kinase [Fulvivirga sedimenti]MCA6074807.1 carbohydrate kinase [Fulvivirga sedimenti]MCA6075984.1 carbohydrate kinase [Fulvivirga sedimenti]MCA6077112.1 carbohydrate kinase [Fulvivirga sedimenti]